MTFSDIKAHLSEFRVGVAGAGGLGSNCAVALARSGVGTLVICDFDVIESPNLNRQYYFTDQLGKFKTLALKENISRITSDVTVITFEEKLNRKNIPLIFRGCDLIVEALDAAEMKEMLIETVQKLLPGTPLIVGSGMAGWGNNETLKFRKLDSSLFVCGDEASEISDNLPPLAPRVAIVANMQANAAIEILMKMKEIKKSKNEDLTE